MFKVVIVTLFLAAVASAGYVAAPAVYSHGYHGYAAAPVVAHAPAYAAVAHAPVVAAPVVKAAVPVATSYANTYKVSVGHAPVVAHAVAAPAYVKSYAAPAVVAAPAVAYGHGYYH